MVPAQLSALLEQHSFVMEPELRRAIAKALILLRNRGLIAPTEYVIGCLHELINCSLLRLFFSLFRVPGMNDTMNFLSLVR